MLSQKSATLHIFITTVLDIKSTLKNIMFLILTMFVVRKIKYRFTFITLTRMKFHTKFMFCLKTLSSITYQIFFYYHKNERRNGNKRLVQLQCRLLKKRLLYFEVSQN